MVQKEITRLCMRCEGKGRVPVPDRDAEIFREYAAGATLAEVGLKHGMSKQRIHQIVSAIDHTVLRGSKAAVPA